MEAGEDQLTGNTMGIFDWLKTPKTNVALLDDVIWLEK